MGVHRIDFQVLGNIGLYNTVVFDGEQLRALAELIVSGQHEVEGQDCVPVGRLRFHCPLATGLRAVTAFARRSRIAIIQLVVINFKDNY